MTADEAFEKYWDEVGWSPDDGRYLSHKRTSRHGFLAGHSSRDSEVEGLIAQRDRFMDLCRDFLEWPDSPSNQDDFYKATADIEKGEM